MEELIAEWERRAEASAKVWYDTGSLVSQAENLIYHTCARELRQRPAAGTPAAGTPAADVPAAVVVVVHQPDNGHVSYDPDAKRLTLAAGGGRREYVIDKILSTPGCYGEWYDEPVTRCCNQPAVKRKSFPVEDAPAEPFSESGI